MPSCRTTRCLLALPVAVLLGACTSMQPSASTQTSVGAGTGTSSGSTASATSVATPSMTSVEAGSSATTTAPPAAAAPKRTKASLQKALLVLDDLPSGYAIEPSDSSSGGPNISSADPRCRQLVDIMNADHAPGALASAHTSFSGGQDGPFVDQSLDALGSAAHVAAFHDKLRAAVKACPKVTLRLPEGRSTMVVHTVRAPDASKDAVAFRVTAQGGALDGFEGTQVATAIGDVDLNMVFIGAYPDEIDDGTHAAYEKAAEELGVKGTSVS